MRHFTFIRLVLFSCIMGGMASGCGADYVYLQKEKSEAEVRQDYRGCVEQQQVQFSSGGAGGQQIVVLDTSRCMESKGYRVVKIEPRKA